MIQKVRELRVTIDGLAQLTKKLHPMQRFLEGEFFEEIQYKNSHPIEKAIDSLFLAKAWLGKVLGALGEDTPYANDGKRKTVEDIEPAADVDNSPFTKSKLSERVEGDDGDSYRYRKMSHVEKVDWLRQEISKVVIEVKSLYSDLDDSKTLQHKVYDPWFVSSLLDITKHLSEARFWLGFELGRIKETSKN